MMRFDRTVDDMRPATEDDLVPGAFVRSIKVSYVAPFTAVVVSKAPDGEYVVQRHSDGSRWARSVAQLLVPAREATDAA